MPSSTIEQLESRLRAYETENERLRAKLAAIQQQPSPVETGASNGSGDKGSKIIPGGDTRLSKEEYRRYGRQMIVPSIGLPGQVRLKQSSVLVIGAGGLGCPAAAYIASAGIGVLGICDGDNVEISNLHRQIAHTTSRVGQSKTESIISYLRDINPHVTYRAHTCYLTPSNAATIIAQYDLVLDCTDHPAVRYLISDTCVLVEKPLISASALRSEGQLLVLNNPPGKGACYRCIWPKPPPPESVMSCGEGGILGPVVGVMGVLMATEAIKVIASAKKDSGDAVIDEEQKKTGGTSLLLYSAFSDTTFRNLKLRGKKSGCIACDAETREISLEKLGDGRLDYVAFCGVREQDRVQEEEKVDVRKFAEIQKQEEAHILIDVRPAVEWGMCRLQGSLNIPITQFIQSLTASKQNPDEPVPSSHHHLPWLPRDPNMPIYIICKQGNDSQTAVNRLKGYFASRRHKDGLIISGHDEIAVGECGEERPWAGGIWDVKGGLVRWAQEVDTNFPVY